MLRARRSQVFNDPKYYTKPFTIKFNVRLLPDTDLIESLCTENEKEVQHRSAKSCKKLHVVVQVAGLFSRARRRSVRSIYFDLMKTCDLVQAGVSVCRRSFYLDC
jgi:hypothetical protein